MNDHPLDPLFRNLRRRVTLDDADREAILELPHTLRSMDAGAYLVREGDRTSHSCLIRSGYAYRHKLVGDGGRQILSIHMAGDMVDLENSLLKVADHSVQVLSSAEVAFIDRAAVMRLARQRPLVGEAMWLSTLVDGSIFREWIANVGRRDARARTAHVLCEFALRQEAAGLGSRECCVLPMTQEQLGDVLGLTAVHVNRTLRSIEAEGLISRNKRAITIDKWQDLRDAGDFNARYLHLEQID